MYPLNNSQLQRNFTKFWDQYKSTIYIVHLRFILVPVRSCMCRNIFTISTNCWDQYKPIIVILHLRTILVLHSCIAKRAKQTICVNIIVPLPYVTHSTTYNPRCVVIKLSLITFVKMNNVHNHQIVIPLLARL